MNSRVRNLTNEGLSAAYFGHSLVDVPGLSLTLEKAISSLSREKDPQLFYEGLLNLGMRLEAKDQLPQAKAIYEAIIRECVMPNSEGGISKLRTPHSELHTLAQQAQDRLDVINGRGSSPARLEFNFRRIAHEAASPTGLFAMGAAGAAFKLTKLATLSRLATTPIGFLGRQAIAHSTAFFAETATFTLAGKSAAQLTGIKQVWRPKALAHEWAGGAAMLLGLKAMGGLAGMAGRRLGVGAHGRAPLQQISRMALPQFGMLSGIMLGNKLSEMGGFRESHDNATTLVDSLATLLQFNVSGRLLNGMLGEAHQRWEQSMELQSDTLAGKFPPRFTLHASPFTIPEFATEAGSAFIPHSEPRTPHSKLNTLNSMMVSDKEEATGKSDTIPPELVPKFQIPEIFSKWDPTLYMALQRQVYRIGGEIFHIPHIQGGEPMWAHQAHRLASEFQALLEFTREGLEKNSNTSLDLSSFQTGREEMQIIRFILNEVRYRATPSIKNPEVRFFFSEFYRPLNSFVNFINRGQGKDLFLSSMLATRTREKLQKIFPSYQISRKSLLKRAIERNTPYPHLWLDPQKPAQESYSPLYDFPPEDQGAAQFIDIQDSDRKIVLLGNVPPIRLKLAGRHSVEIFSKNPGVLFLTREHAGTPRDSSPLKINLRSWLDEDRQADYLEAYDILSPADLKGKFGIQYAQALLAKLKGGGIGYVVSRDSLALRRLVTILTRNQWAEILHGSFISPLPVISERSDQESSHYIFIRKMPDPEATATTRSEFFAIK